MSVPRICFFSIRAPLPERSHQYGTAIRRMTFPTSILKMAQIKNTGTIRSDSITIIAIRITKVIGTSWYLLPFSIFRTNC